MNDALQATLAHTAKRTRASNSANVLKTMGVCEGYRVIVDLPMIPKVGSRALGDTSTLPDPTSVNDLIETRMNRARPSGDAHPQGLEA